MCELNATALCINRGGHRPKPTNKTTVSAAGDLPVQNGKTDFTLSATVTFQPECSPPMTVVFTDVTVTDTTNGLTTTPRHVATRFGVTAIERRRHSRPSRAD